MNISWKENFLFRDIIHVDGVVFVFLRQFAFQIVVRLMLSSITPMNVDKVMTGKTYIKIHDQNITLIIVLFFPSIIHISDITCNIILLFNFLYLALHLHMEGGVMDKYNWKPISHPQHTRFRIYPYVSDINRFYPCSVFCTEFFNSYVLFCAYYDRRVVPALDGTIYLADINGTRYLGSM